MPSLIGVTNSGDQPPTTLTTHVVDEVTVKSAVYDSATRTITVVATSSDKGAPTLAPSARPSSRSPGFPDATVAAGPDLADPADVTFTASNIQIPPAFVRVLLRRGRPGHGRH